MVYLLEMNVDELTVLVEAVWFDATQEKEL